MGTPEQNLYQRARNNVNSILPKGRWMFQRIESTATNNGIPDTYFSYRQNHLWIETKTLMYKVSTDQLKWAYDHTRASGQTYILTTAPKPTKPTTKPPPSDATSLPTPCSNPFTYPNPHTNMPEQLLACPIAPDELVLVAFDDEMTDYSTLGSFLKKKNPPMTRWVDWLKSLG